VTAIAAAPATSAPRRTEATSALIVAALVVVGILATLGLRTAVTSGTTNVTAGGVTAAVPGSWRLAVGAGDVAFVASNPNDLDQRYLARVVDPHGASLADVAARESAAKASLKAGIVQVDTSNVVVGGTAGVAVSYAYVSNSGGTATLIKGEDIFVPSGAKVLDLAYEAPADAYDAGVDTFHSFVSSARVAS
jgi:hypothetical protein